MAGGGSTCLLRWMSVPVSERPDEGVGDQLHGGLGGKHHPHFDVLIGEHAGGFGAGGVPRRLRPREACWDRLSRSGGGVGAHRLHSVVV